MSSMAEAPAGLEKPRAEVLDEFRAELDRYERIIVMMEAILEPMLLPGEDDSMTVPEVAPMHQYQSAVHRLGHLNSRAERLRSRMRP